MYAEVEIIAVNSKSNGVQCHIQTSRIILCETSNYREQVAWFPIIDLVDISCPWVATDARDRIYRIEYVASLGCALVNLHLQTGQYIA